MSWFSRQKDFLWDCEAFLAKFEGHRKKFQVLRPLEFGQNRETWAVTFQSFRNGINKHELLSALMRVRGDLLDKRSEYVQLNRGMSSFNVRSKEIPKTIASLSEAITLVEQVTTALSEYDDALELAINACRYRGFDEVRAHLAKASAELGRVWQNMMKLKTLCKEQPVLKQLRTQIIGAVSGELVYV